MPATTAGWVALATVAAATTSIAVAVDQQQKGKSAKKEAKKQAAAFSAKQLQAGEYWEEINAEQMELQSQASQISLLSDVIKSKQQAEPRILTLPPAKTYTATERFNMAVDELLKGGSNA